MKLRVLVAVATFAVAAGGCAPGAPEISAARGRALFQTKGEGGLSPSNLNRFACATCHDETAPATPATIKPGAPLAGATLRASFWGGAENDLLASINACRAHFMVAGTPLAADDPDADALYAYLVSLEPGDGQPVPFTVMSTVVDVPRGDPVAGRARYDAACASCHGTPHDGAGRIGPRVPVLPDQTITDHAGYSASLLRLVFLEKTRHGGFFGYGGDMPPFSLEVLSDEALADILAALGQ